jgi:hypothetical protein
VRLRLLLACSCIPLGAIIVWAGGGTSLGMLLVVLIVYAVVLAYAVLFESSSEQRPAPEPAQLEPQPGNVRMVERARGKAPAPPGAGETQARERHGLRREPPGARRQPEPAPEPEPEPDPFADRFPPVPHFERPASLMAGIASRVGPQPGSPPASQESRVSASGRWNVWALERLATERLSKDSDYERSLLLVYLRDFASSDGTLPPEFNGLVESTFPDLIRELSADHR